MMILPLLPLSVHFYAHPVVCLSPLWSKAATVHPETSLCIAMACPPKPVSNLNRCSMADAALTSQNDKGQSSPWTVSTTPRKAPQSCWGCGPLAVSTLLVIICLSKEVHLLEHLYLLSYSQPQLGFPQLCQHVWSRCDLALSHPSPLPLLLPWLLLGQEVPLHAGRPQKNSSHSWSSQPDTLQYETKHGAC